MYNLKTLFRNLVHVTISVMVAALFLTGCVQSSKNKKTTSVKTSGSTDTTTKLPTFTTGNNFIQNGESIYLGVVNLDLSFADSVQLRGKDVDSYIRSTGTSTVACLTSRFSATSTIVLLAAIPRSVYNFTTQALEYYYGITPADSTSNQSFCQKTGLINQLFTSYGLTPKYKLADICSGTSCLSSYASLSLELYNTSGNAITQIATKQLIFSLTNNPASSTPIGQSCTESTQCKSQGYDCCSSGQCVSDLSLRPGVSATNPTPEYAQALQDILNNPSNIYLYPQFYFICSQPVNNPSTPVVDPTTPITEAEKRLRNLTDLYNCTTKTDGEAGVCSITHENFVIKNYGDARDFVSSGIDDKSFNKTFTHLTVSPLSLVAIDQVSYGGVVIFDSSLKDVSTLVSPFYEDDNIRIEGYQNDDITAPTKVKVKRLPASATSKDIQIKYKADVSCTKVNTALATCEKYYIQDQGSPANELGVAEDVRRKRRVTNHYPTSNKFKLPDYVDTSRTITVEVDGLKKIQGTDWELTIASPVNTIDFLPAKNLQVAKDQKVRITYFVNLDAHPNVMFSKKLALDKIGNICSCGTTTCGLAPIKNTAGAIVDYSCVYPEAAPVDPPMSQKVYLSSKTVPVRLFDKSGTAQKTVGATTAQEGAAFKYRGDNLLNPNNQPDTTGVDTSDTYIGFNEIYGSISYATNSAKPAQEVNVKKDTTYDIYVDRGAYSNCVQCGNDYYSQLTKLFPLTQFGGGSIPLLGQTNRSMTAGIRSDEMKFGRACLVPASMLPWSHTTYSTEQEQRLNRLSAQHFYYANGYQYDWYGFDYGSVIGSFDGVKWFSIGSNRRIKAESTKMFIAVNGVFGDMAVENTFEVTINDSVLNTSNNMVTTDYNSDGAECQQFHQCSTDNDCATTLGWEYACAPIGEITTSWPKFDANGKEIPEVASDKTFLTSILGISNSGKRCVYRGRGALCTPNYASVNINTTFNKTTTPSMHSCSDNTYCQTMTINGDSSPKFNNRINRYGRVPTSTTNDTFGLAALVAGRPFAFNPVETPRATTMKNINANKVQGMCLPGRDAEKTTFSEQNNSPAKKEFFGDRVVGIGMTHVQGLVTAEPNYLNACSIMDSSKNYYRNTGATASALFTNTAVFPYLKLDAGSQALSTNALSKINKMFEKKEMTLGIYKTNSALLNTAAYTQNRCLRAPGASCFSDMDCGPSKLIADKAKLLSSDDSDLTAILNKYEIKFWQEELICSQATSKTDALYDPRNNRCCRDVGNVISLPSSDSVNKLNYRTVAGIDYVMDSNVDRYSRSATLYKELNTPSTTFPDLRVAAKDECPVLNGIGCKNISTLDNQFKTFSLLAEKTSCSGDWVRTFANGSHKWQKSNLQTYSANMFQCFNWYPGDGGYTCASYDEDDPACPILQTGPTSPKAIEILNYMGKLELLGIPQVTMETPAHYIGATERGLSCKSNPGDRSIAYPAYKTPTQIFTPGAISEYQDLTKVMFSAGDATNFQAASFKQVFKPDEIVSCLPAGTQMKAGDSPDKCCTGIIGPTLKCQIDDYVDLSVYTNRYVSSAAKSLSTSLFDQAGYIKDPAQVALLACNKQMCASGVVSFGILISSLRTPGHVESGDKKIYRFMEGVPADNKDGLLGIYNLGLKLNNHAYCVPKSLAASVQEANSTDIKIFACGY
jgi:hypothetical protein